MYTQTVHKKSNKHHDVIVVGKLHQKLSINHKKKQGIAITAKILAPFLILDKFHRH